MARFDHTLTEQHQAAANHFISQLENDINRLYSIVNGECGDEMHEDDFMTLRIYYWGEFICCGDEVPDVKPADLANFLDLPL